eukprot:s755_g9.t1
MCARANLVIGGVDSQTARLPARQPDSQTASQAVNLAKLQQSTDSPHGDSGINPDGQHCGWLAMAFVSAGFNACNMCAYPTSRVWVIWLRVSYLVQSRSACDCSFSKFRPGVSSFPVHPGHCGAHVSRSRRVSGPQCWTRDDAAAITRRCSDRAVASGAAQVQDAAASATGIHRSYGGSALGATTFRAYSGRKVCPKRCHMDHA